MGAVARPAAHSAVPCPPRSRQTGDEPIRTKTDQTVRLRVPAGAPSLHLAQRAVGDPDLALCAGGDRGVVRDDHQGQALPVQLLEELEHAGVRHRVQVAGGLDLFEELHREGLPLVIITHDAAVSARAQRQVRISDGTLSEVAVSYTHLTLPT